MIDFQYTAKEKGTGKIVKGTIAADNETAAGRLLIEKNLYPIKFAQAGTQTIAGINVSNLSRVKAKDRVIFTRQLSTLVKAGLPITQALETAVEQVASPKFKQILERIKASIEGGSTLADAFAQFPEVFNHTYVSLVAAGEAAGTLDTTLERLASTQEKELSMISKIRGAMIYPVLILGVIVAVLIFMLVSVLPQVGSLYKELGKTLPILTRVLISVTNFITSFWYIVIIMLVAAVFGLRAYIKTPQGRRNFDLFKLNMPAFSTLFRKVYMARFTRTMGSLVSSGVPILEALHIVSESVGNVIIRDIILEAVEGVKGGKALSEMLFGRDYILSLVPQMIKIGEDSGTLSDMLDKVASFYEEEVDQTIRNLSTIIEPVLMIILGLMVFFIIIAILYPVYSLVGGGIGSGENLGSSGGSGGSTSAPK